MAIKNSKPALVVEDLRMRYGDIDVLKGVSFSATQGEVLVLLGPNGAGKTTTIEILEGFRGRSDGTVRVLGTDPNEGDERWRARLGIVLQSWRDHSKWKVHELLHHLGQYYQPYSSPQRPRPLEAKQLIQLVGLEAQANHEVYTLSGGQRRRLDVAIGLVGNPELLFLDEPTVGFDPQARREFHDVIHRLSDLDNTTVLLTTHDLGEAEKLGDRIIVLAGGTIVANGTADQLASEYSSQSEVIWTHNKQRHVHVTGDSTAYLRELLNKHPAGITELEVRRASLEDTYIKIVQQHETSRTAKTGEQ
ncbi:MAG TPA: ABC transporter ATP-binding protein [Candidatus Saccharimonadales bacterium]|nr:ABC transporter ATP-binding protein [Candidatus Saccharimonadales bacterium]